MLYEESIDKIWGDPWVFSLKYQIKVPYECMYILSSMVSTGKWAIDQKIKSSRSWLNRHKGPGHMDNVLDALGPSSDLRSI